MASSANEPELCEACAKLDFANYRCRKQPSDSDRDHDFTFGERLCVPHLVGSQGELGPFDVDGSQSYQVPPTWVTHSESM